eukprot:CAMPEP_0119516592 /NCGR_PEP_ID=MMETSP1344-20130328/33755_1 /TAXON_ID=236787 /ORGANISM="Florenciella parvula, Strain CCMP2471" /LENGTH=53 /DNA_ID=CAMNT_0007554109 /DNA_START=1 /DNA_END=165 /DNA_ORIENTATION=+
MLATARTLTTEGAARTLSLANLSPFASPMSTLSGSPRSRASSRAVSLTNSPLT